MGSDGQFSIFFERRGFLPSRDDPLTLFRSITDIAVSVAAAGISGPELQPDGRSL